MDTQQRLFFDDVYDALRAIVQALGGYKPVGSKLWPEKAADVAGRLLSDCLNPAKAEKLDPQQVVLLLTWGREVGCHSGMTYIASEAGYDAEPIAPEHQRDRLADAILEGVRTLDRALKVAERFK